jgi:hypothetical protein
MAVAHEVLERGVRVGLDRNVKCNLRIWRVPLNDRSQPMLGAGEQAAELSDVDQGSNRPNSIGIE